VLFLRSMGRLLVTANVVCVVSCRVVSCRVKVCDVRNEPLLDLTVDNRGPIEQGSSNAQ
jgi:hypothetical protein